MSANDKKPSGKKSEASSSKIQQLCEAMTSGQKRDDGIKIQKYDVTIALWNYALMGEKERAEIQKHNPMNPIISLLERGTVEEQYAAIGCLQALARSPLFAADIFTQKVLHLSVQLLLSDRHRVRLPAAQLLSMAAARIDLAQRVSDLALMPLYQMLSDPGAAWAQLRQTQLYSVTALRHLIEKVSQEDNDVRQVRRLQLLNAQALPVLVTLVNYTPRMPVDSVIPAPMPAIPKKPKQRSKKGAAIATPLGCKDAIATQAAACLRYLALCPEFVDELISTGSLSPFVEALRSASEEQAAFLSGVLWEVCAEREVAEQVAAAQGVPALLHVITTNYIAAFSKATKKVKRRAPEKEGDKKGGAKGKPDLRLLEPAEPPCLPMIAVCNATGALNHLTFLDEAKRQVALAGGVPILTACLKLKDPHVYENTVGALWNTGLDVKNEAAMRAVHVPEYLAHPVPAGWNVPEEGEEELQEDEAAGPDLEEPQLDGDGGTTFLTSRAPTETG